jgi:hypothetical protein
MTLDPAQLGALRAFFASRPVLRAYLFESYGRFDTDAQSDLDLLVDLDYSQRIGLNFVNETGFGTLAEDTCRLGFFRGGVTKVAAHHRRREGAHLCEMTARIGCVFCTCKKPSRKLKVT